ncbi:MAG: hydroxyacid dehydrogenase [Anaerolineales bacterium]|nr:hydroxyacid dehydrogenase [Anaerolineales bacterium]
MKPLVYIPEPIAASGLDLLKRECRCLAPWDSGSADEPEGDRDADAVLVRLFQANAEFIRSAPRLKVIAKHGVGVDNIDLAAARERGITVVNTPTANANAVAEHALALIMALARQIKPADTAVRDGRFHERDQFQGVELRGKRLGVIGLGRIGSRLAEMASSGLAMKVLAYDPFVAEENYAGPAALEQSLERVMRKADFLSLHVALNTETRHMINAKTLGWVTPQCRLINTSRGAVVQETALVEALAEGRLAGAALDVFEDEPLPPGHPLLAAPNTILTPHISSSTREAMDRMSLDAARGVLDVLNGREPAFPVSTEGLHETL